MGRVWDFLNQDASKAADRVAVPYPRFVTSHTLVMWAVCAVVGAAARAVPGTVCQSVR